jgi:hypothetical protein
MGDNVFKKVGFAPSQQIFKEELKKKMEKLMSQRWKS